MNSHISGNTMNGTNNLPSGVLDVFGESDKAQNEYVASKADNSDNLPYLSMVDESTKSSMATIRTIRMLRLKCSKNLRLLLNAGGIGFERRYRQSVQHRRSEYYEHSGQDGQAGGKASCA